MNTIPSRPSALPLRATDRFDVHLYPYCQRSNRPWRRFFNLDAPPGTRQPVQVFTPKVAGPAALYAAAVDAGDPASPAVVFDRLVPRRFPKRKRHDQIALAVDAEGCEIAEMRRLSQVVSAPETHL